MKLPKKIKAAKMDIVRETAHECAMLALFENGSVCGPGELSWAELRKHLKRDPTDEEKRKFRQCFFEALGQPEPSNPFEQQGN